MQQKKKKKEKKKKTQEIQSSTAICRGKFQGGETCLFDDKIPNGRDRFRN